MLKRCWRPYQDPRRVVNPASMGESSNMRLSYLPEADRYRRVWEDRIYVAEDIKIGSDDDSTLGHIRRKLTLDTVSPDNLSRKRPNKPRAEDVMEHHLATSNKTGHGFLSAPTEDLVSRVHMQIIHGYTGWPLRHFRHLGELLQVIRDVVVGE